VIATGAAAATSSSLDRPLSLRRSIQRSLRCRGRTQIEIERESRSSNRPIRRLSVGMAPAIKVSDERAQQVDALSTWRARARARKRA